MSSSPVLTNNKWFHFNRITTRLTVAYTLILVVVALVIFSVIYFSISRTLEERDWRLLNQKVQEYSDRLEIKGLDDFKQYFAVDINHDPESSLYVQLFSADHRVLFTHEAFPAFEFASGGDMTKARRLRLWMRNSDDYALVMVKPLPAGEFLLVAKSTDGLSSQMNRLRYLFGYAISFMALSSFLAATVLARRGMKPVRELIRSVKNLENGSLSDRVTIPIRDDDLNELKHSFNHLLDTISKLVSSITEAFDHLAHDIRTPVTRLRGRAEIALNGVEDLDEYREALQSCYENSDRILKFMDNLTQITEAENRSLNIKYQLKSLGEMVREMMDLYEIAFEEKAILVKQILVKNDRAYLDPNLIRRVIANLLDNAHKYTPEGGEIVIETYRTDKHVVLSIRDSGHGIPQEEQNLVWNRLYRGDKSRSEHGMGLGLTFVKAVVEAHGGVVNVISPVYDGHGTEFLIKFKHDGSEK